MEVQLLFPLSKDDFILESNIMPWATFNQFLLLLNKLNSDLKNGFNYT